MATVLVVDDDKLVRWALGAGLRRDAHDVVCVRSASEAVEQAQRNLFDVVIVDLEMPGLDGELLREMQRLSPGVKVVVLSASPDRVRHILSDSVADECIQKPFMLDAIRKFVRQTDQLRVRVSESAVPQESAV